jgi:hypothetical protein
VPMVLLLSLFSAACSNLQGASPGDENNGAQADVEGPAGLDQPILVSTRISCRRSDVGFAQGVWTSKNWEGDNRQPGEVVVSVRDVFTAPETGT